MHIRFLTGGNIVEFVLEFIGFVALGSYAISQEGERKEKAKMALANYFLVVLLSWFLFMPQAQGLGVLYWMGVIVWVILIVIFISILAELFGNTK